MDKLSEPEFRSDENWPRLKNGVEDYIQEKRKPFPFVFTALAAGSIFRYWREVTFYSKNVPMFVGLVVPAFLFSSYQLATIYCTDYHAEAALRNNKAEKEYIEQYRKLWREANDKKIDIPEDCLY